MVLVRLGRCDRYLSPRKLICLEERRCFFPEVESDNHRRSGCGHWTRRRIRCLSLVQGGYMTVSQGLVGREYTDLRWLKVSKPTRP